MYPTSNILSCMLIQKTKTVRTSNATMYQSHDQLVFLCFQQNCQLYTHLDTFCISTIMVVVYLMCLVILSSIKVIASSCVPQLTQACSCVTSSDKGCLNLTNSGSCVTLSDKTHSCKLTILSHKISVLFSTNVTSISVDATVKHIEPGIFNKFQKLQKLCLGGNHIERISSNIFANLPCLQKLDLGFNRIK